MSDVEEKPKKAPAKRGRPKVALNLFIARPYLWIADDAHRRLRLKRTPRKRKVMRRRNRRKRLHASRALR